MFYFSVSYWNIVVSLEMLHIRYLEFIALCFKKTSGT